MERIGGEDTGLPTSIRKVVVASFVGTTIEWYDFFIYTTAAALVLPQLFFPSFEPLAGTLASFATYAVGFLARPLGGVIFGHYGDKIGRKAMLVTTLLIMGIATFLVGLLPTYETIGIWAPILLVVLRLLQGLGLGGEWGGAVLMAVEHSPEDKRGLNGSWPQMGVPAGLVLGTGAFAAVSAISGDAFVTWGWRVPFLLGVTVGLAGLYLRRALAEEPLGPAERSPHLPVVEAFRTEWRSILKIFGFNVVQAVGFYVCFVYVTTYWRQVDFISASKSLEMNSLTMLLLLGLYPVAGALSDRIGRKPLLLAAEAGMLLLSWPLFWLMHHPSTPVILLGQAGFAVLIAFIGGVGAAMMAEVFPRRVRCTALSIGYNACFALFGGTAPMVAVYLIQRSHNDLSPAFYLMGAAAVAFAATLTLPETAKAPLR